MKWLIECAVGILLASSIIGCQSINSLTPRGKTQLSNGHLQAPLSREINQDIPALINTAPSIPLPSPQTKEVTHTVVVSNVPVEELIFSLARDAKLNLDIDDDVSGLATLNAVDQPLSVILNRIAKNNNLVYGIESGVLHIRKDKPFLRNYKIDYINMARSAESLVTVSTQINSTGQGAGESSGGGSGDNNSSTQVINKSANNFWDTLYGNIEGLLYRQQDVANSTLDVVSKSDGVAGANGAMAESQSGATAGGNQNIILNKESGIMAIRATAKQHEEIELFLNEVLFSTQRQVLIEATIAEVKLSDGYQAGIDWNMLSSKIGEIVDVRQQFTDITLLNPPAFTFKLDQIKSNGDSIQTTLSALETFGDVKIMSSPKVMALNNQTALLKVVDNIVYFTVDVNIETSSSDTNNNTIGFVTYETEIKTVPVGFVMSVTPYISENSSVTLNVRPTISRVIRQARDPNPALVDVGVVSEIPVIQVREVESVLKVSSGDIAVMGGLMQDEQSKQKRGVPLLSRIPILGALFRYDNNVTEKTELVIFIRPVVIEHASVETDLSPYSAFLPNKHR